MAVTIYNGSFKSTGGNTTFGSNPTLNVVTSGLVLWVDAGNSTSYPGSGTSWFDLSGNSNTATLTNGPVYVSNNGGYFDLDGSNDFINIPAATSINNLGAQTNIAWVYIKGTTQQPVLWYKSDGNVTAGWVVDLSNSTAITGLGFNYVTSGNNLRYYINYSQIPKNQWVMLATTYDGTFPGTSLPGTIKIYINGVENTTTSYSDLGNGSHTSDAAIDLTFGSGAGGTGTGASQYLSGSVSVLQLYNRGLSSSEILQNFNAYKNRYGL